MRLYGAGLTLDRVSHEPRVVVWLMQPIAQIAAEDLGSVAEWMKALVSKTSGVKALAGSNPVTSASFVIRDSLLINIFNKPLNERGIHESEPH
jgi:hypothetical protein